MEKKKWQMIGPRRPCSGPTATDKQMNKYLGSQSTAHKQTSESLSKKKNIGEGVYLFQTFRAHPLVKRKQGQKGTCRVDFRDISSKTQTVNGEIIIGWQADEGTNDRIENLPIRKAPTEKGSAARRVRFTQRRSRSTRYAGITTRCPA